MFPLDAALSGHLAATVVEVLLVDAGYQVVPLGIERIIRELRTADAERFRDIAPPRLRSLPDFFVIDPDSNQGSLVEVKFRRYLHPKFVEDMTAVYEHWAPIVPSWRSLSLPMNGRESSATFAYFKSNQEPS